MPRPAGTGTANQEAPTHHRFGKPVAEVVPPSPDTAQNNWIGFMKDSMQILGDIVARVVAVCQACRWPIALPTATGANTLDLPVGVAVRGQSRLPAQPLRRRNIVDEA